MPVASHKLPAAQGNLESESFKLLMQRMEYDAQCFRVTKNRMATWESTRYHQELTMRKQQWDVSFHAAETFMNKNTRIIVCGSAEQTIREINEFARECTAKHGLHKDNLVPGSFSFCE